MNRREAIAALGAWALLPAAAIPSRADLADDVRILRQALTLHPGLHRYARPARVEERLLRFERAFLAAQSLERRYLALSRFLASIRCGHSYCNFFNQKPEVASALFDRPTRLPVHFTWIGGRMIVTRDPDRLGLAPGTEIESIDGLRASDLLASLMPYARADGNNDAKRRSLLAVAGGETIETFDVFHGLAHGAPRGGANRLGLRSPDGRRSTAEVPAIDLAARQAQRITRKPVGDSPVWNWTVRPDGIALLEMPSWALYNSRWDWRAWLDERLSSLRGAKGLIVDIRDNEGGQDCGDVLLARLAGETIAVPAAERRVRFRTTPAALDPYLDTWDRSFRTLGVDGSPLGGGFYRLPAHTEDFAITPLAPRLALPVAALVGPVNSSATFQFAQKARSSGLVRLFGETTGGNLRGINGGAYFFVRLPASGIEFDLPLIGYFPPGRPADSGLAPDVEVAPTADDLFHRRDPVITAAAAWLLGRAT